MKKPFLPRRGFNVLAALLAVAIIAPAARAVIREPDNLVWGNIVLGTEVVTAEQTTIVVEARRSLSDAPIASYRIGSNPGAGGFYSLAIPLESINPISNPAAVSTGEQLLILVHNGEFVRYLTLYTVGERGEMIRLDLGDVDSDGNGLIDNWERQYFGADGQDPDGDPDQDNVRNLDEMLAGTNPIFPDARHPADTNPTNNVMSIHEVTAYASAWKAGTAWPVAPTNIPVDYVTRAGFLWKNGEQYLMDTNSIAVGAPLWWTNAPPALTNAELALATISADRLRSVAKKSLSPAELLNNGSLPASRITRSFSPLDPNGTDLSVVLAVSPGAEVKVYAVEEGIPAGRNVAQISDEGAFDPVSNKLRWGPFFDNEIRELTYRLQSESSASGSGGFSGIASFDGRSIEIGGQHGWGEPGLLRWEIPKAAPDGNLTLEFDGEPGVDYVIEVSSDLVEWAEVTRATADANGLLRTREAIQPLLRQRFFRARQADE
ncbi:MAG: hypothetical protein O2960_11210 [Verrucomicrobia bacterium]|nr:hypothetical protein [Verrucomicrobiota bacterium]